MGFYKVHPRGDIILTLHNPNAPFADCASDEDASTKPSNSATPTEDACEITTEPPKTDATQEQSLPKFLLSSSHLTLASGYFKRMLTGPWKEATTDTESGTYHLGAHDWDEKAFLVLMNIIHGRSREIPRQVDLEFMTKIAVMVDYYKCHEAVDVWFFEVWEKNLPTSDLSGRDLTMRCFISWVLGEENTFADLTCEILWHSIGPLPTWGLAFPVDIISAIDLERKNLLMKAISCLDHVFLTLQQSDDCSFECSSMMLGAFIKELYSKHIPYPLPTTPYLGYSFSLLYTGTRTFKKLKWLNKNHACPPIIPPARPRFDTFGGFGVQETVLQPKDTCNCDLASRIVPTMDRLRGGIKGLKLGDFPQSIQEDDL